MKKENYIRIRLTDEEKKIIKQKAKKQNLTMSDYIRTQALNGKVVDYSYLQKLIVQINRIGNNINQATKLMHLYKPQDDIDYNYICKEFLKMKELVEKEL